MTHFGTAFRKIRQSKNLSLESVAAGIMSKQGLSSFEREKTDISVQLLDQLLKKIHLTIDEFFHICEIKETRHQMLDQLKSLFIQEDLDGIDLFIAHFRQRFQYDRDIQYLHLAIIGDIFRSKLNHTAISIQDSAMIKNYLYQVESWGDYELELFANTLFALSPEDVQIIYTTVLKNIQAIDCHDDLSNHKFTDLMFNLVAYSIDRKRFADAATYLEQTRQTIAANDLYASFLEKYDEALLAFLKDPNASSQQCWHYVEMLKELGNVELFEFYAHDLRQHEQEKLNY